MAEADANQKAHQLFQEVFESFSLEFAESGDRYPGTQAEVREARRKLADARALNPTDPEVMEALNTLEETLDEAESRQFAGSWWMIGILSVFIAVMFYMTALQPLFQDITVEQAGRYLKSRVESLERSIARYETVLDTTQTKKVEKNYEGYLENAQDDLKKYQKMSPKEYRGEWKRRNFGNAMKSMFRWGIWIALVVGYYFSARTPTYLLLKRQKQLALMKKSGNVVKAMIFGALGFFLAMPAAEITKIKWSDGTTSEEVDFAPLMIKLIGIVFIVALVVYAMMVVLPWLVVINYLRNYQSELVEKYFDMMMAKLRGARKTITGQ